jgi:predicted dehydrogenase
MDPVRFVVIGLGGYGLSHIEAVRWLAREGQARLVGVVALDVDRRQRPELATALQQEGTVLFHSVDQFMDSAVQNTEVLTVPLGIHQHVPVSVQALRAGLHVYCEKPAAATVQEVDELIAAKEQSDRLVAIGYQHVYSNSIQQLKARIGDGRLGPVRALSLSCGWPRSLQYFARNEWTGRVRRGDAWILDSPANNANAHYVMNALYLTGSTSDAGIPVSVRAELFRANDIESTDTVQVQMTMIEGAKLNIILTHANWFANGPVMHCVCEKGKAYWQSDNGKTYIRYDDGTHEEFNNLTHAQWRYEGFRNLVNAINGKAHVTCTPGVARAQTLAINLMHESCPAVWTIPERYISTVEDWELWPPNTRGTFRRVEGIDEYMHLAFAEGRFFSELGVPWALGVCGKEVRGKGYSRFPGAAFLGGVPTKT